MVKHNLAQKNGQFPINMQLSTNQHINSRAGNESKESALIVVEEEGKGMERIPFTCPAAYNIIGDGNCVCRAFSKKVYSSVEMHEFIRMYLVEVMKK